MQNYPEPNGRGWDIAEKVMLWGVAILLVAGVFYAIHFAKIIMEARTW